MTYFGVITPVISSVLSVFMLGLALGTFLFARVTRQLNPKNALAFYVLVEVLIALFALLVPTFFEWGYQFLLSIEYRESDAYLFYSWGIITLALLPACTLIGATLPLVMVFLRNTVKDEKNFGFLYFANLIGGVIGCIIPLLFIELYGFQKTLIATTVANVLAAFLALSLYRHSNTQPGSKAVADNYTPADTRYKWVLFITGFVSLGSEVVWIKLFTPAVGTSVYAFSAILAIYLLSNFAGICLYLYKPAHLQRAQSMAILLPVGVLLPFYTVAFIPGVPLSVIGIVPVCFILGYLTPYIVDNACRNHPQHTAYAYIYNLLGCVAGPVFTTYVFFPATGLKGTLIVYACAVACVPLFLYGIKQQRLFATGALLFAAIGAGTVLTGPEEAIRKQGVLYRDHTGYVGATGKGMGRKLLVNGIGMTRLGTTTKIMAHLPLSYFPGAKSALVICFGMGTTLKSLTTWPLQDITVVELSRGVASAFPYFHKEATQVLADPRVHVVIDDGRRYLNRTHATYDVITIDPPPPVHASGSGLLYSDEFYVAAKGRLSENGILAQWLPRGDSTVKQAVFAAIRKHFKFVVVYKGIKNSGFQFIASDHKLPVLQPSEFLGALTPAARVDLMQWHKGTPIMDIARRSLRHIPHEVLMKSKNRDIVLSDDKPYNEFYFFRSRRTPRMATPY